MRSSYLELVKLGVAWLPSGTEVMLIAPIDDPKHRKVEAICTESRTKTPGMVALMRRYRHLLEGF